MNSTSFPLRVPGAGDFPDAPAGFSRSEWIGLNESLWDITCRHLLGAMPGREYRDTLGRLLAGTPTVPARGYTRNLSLERPHE